MADDIGVSVIVHDHVHFGDAGDLVVYLNAVDSLWITSRLCWMEWIG